MSGGFDCDFEVGVDGCDCGEEELVFVVLEEGLCWLFGEFVFGWFEVVDLLD